MCLSKKTDLEGIKVERFSVFSKLTFVDFRMATKNDVTKNCEVWSASGVSISRWLAISNVRSMSGGADFMLTLTAIEAQSFWTPNVD